MEVPPVLAGGAQEASEADPTHSCEVVVEEGSLETLQRGALSGARAVPSAAGGTVVLGLKSRALQDIC